MVSKLNQSAFDRKIRQVKPEEILKKVNEPVAANKAN